ncbi:MAG: nuclear transport factor 2 family protein [Sphingobium sp.]
MESNAAVEVVDKAYKALLSDDFEGFMSVFDDQSQMIEPDSLPYGGTATGLAAIQEKVGALMASWSEFHAELVSLAGTGDTVFALCQLKAKSQKSGVEINMPVAEVWKIRSGKVVSLRPFYADTVVLKAALA